MKEREILELTPEQGREIIYGDSDSYEIISDDIISTSRWSANHYIIIKRISDNKFFADDYSEGLTEMQDESPYEYNSPDFREVFEVEKTIITYE